MTIPRRPSSGPQRTGTKTQSLSKAATATAQAIKGTPALGSRPLTGRSSSRLAPIIIEGGTPRGGAAAIASEGGRRHGRGQQPMPAGNGLKLRAKFMIVLSGVTVVAMVLLGWIMASKADKYLFSQKQHDGIELARVAAAVASATADQFLQAEEAYGGTMGSKRRSIPEALRLKIQANLNHYFEESKSWEKDSTIAVSDILAIKLSCPDRIQELSNKGVGEDENAGAPITGKYETLFLPKAGSTITIPDGMEVSSLIRREPEGDIPVYRFKVRLDPTRFGGLGLEPNNFALIPHIRVDINASSVDSARAHLYLAITLGVLISIALVIGVANWLAQTITRPLDLLVKDMHIVAEGKLDHVTVAHSQDEIGVLAEEFNRMTSNLNAAQSALVEQEKAEYELSIAREVQRQLLPANSPQIAGYECASFYQGARAVSGDYFDFIDLGDGQWGFIIADVSGKGIPGSMVMAVTRTIIRLMATKHVTRAADTLKETNKLIARQIKRGMFVTAFYAVLDTRTGALTYASAGHNPMIIYRSAGKSFELASGKGIALGFNEGPIFDRTIETHQTVLNSGDAIVLYTDGFPEAMNAANEEFGDDKFNALVPKYAGGSVQGLIDGLVNEIAQHRGEADQSDDLTLLTVRRI